jgi:hypothetical protein
MKLTPDIIWLAPAALTIGFVLGYGLRSFVSFLRHRRVRRERYSMQSGRDRRMEPQGSDQDWRTDLERDVSEVTLAPAEDPHVCPQDAKLVPTGSTPELRTEAQKLYAQYGRLRTRKAE